MTQKMTNLLFTTLTGVDQFTSLEEIENISLKYPFVEWGILYSESPSGALGYNRFPNQKWFKDNIDKIKHIQENTGASFALHVCGKAVQTLLSQENVFLSEIIPVFNRIQINLIYKEKNLSQLESLLKVYPDIQFITQHNNANKELYKLIEAKNHQVLFDSSGGRGVLSEDWISPLSEKVYGYAGGLGHENIEENIEKILQQVKDRYFWVDMENKIRTDDKLDLEKCIKVLDIVSRKINDKTYKNKIIK